LAQEDLAQDQTELAEEHGSEKPRMVAKHSIFAVDEAIEEEADGPDEAVADLDDLDGEPPKYRHPLTLKVPTLPASRSAIDAHMTSHIPYADWCQACVEGRAKENKHVKGHGHATEHSRQVVQADHDTLSNLPGMLGCSSRS